MGAWIVLPQLQLIKELVITTQILNVDVGMWLLLYDLY